MMLRGSVVWSMQNFCFEYVPSVGINGELLEGLFEVFMSNTMHDFIYAKWSQFFNRESEREWKREREKEEKRGGEGEGKDTRRWHHG